MTPCAFALVRHRGKILLAQRASGFAFAGHWCFPGGVVERDETREAAAIRETIEETGIICRPGEIIEQFTSGENQITIFLADYVSGEIAIDETEISAADWYNLDEALALPLAFDCHSTISALEWPSAALELLPDATQAII